jgi:hypothetical protein
MKDIRTEFHGFQKIEPLIQIGKSLAAIAGNYRGDTLKEVIPVTLDRWKVLSLFPQAPAQHKRGIRVGVHINKPRHHCQSSGIYRL